MDRTGKKILIESLHEMFNQVSLIVVTHQTGLTVSESTALRVKIREVGAGFKVTKNRLTKLALKGTDYESISDLFVGPTAIAYSIDPIAAAKAVVEYAKKNNKLAVIGGSMDGNRLDRLQIEALAELPSLDVLRSQLLGVVNGPAQKLATLLQTPASQLARVLNAYSEQDQAV